MSLRSLSIILVWTLLPALLAGCATPVTPTAPAPAGFPQQDVWDFDLDPAQWRLDWTGAGTDYAQHWYIPAGQPRDRWDQVVHSLYSLQRLSPRAAYAALIQHAALNCPSLTSTVFEETTDTILFEWSRAGDCPRAASPWHELMRVTITSTGAGYLSFSIKSQELDAVLREQWLVTLRNARLQPAVASAIATAVPGLPAGPIPTATPALPRTPTVGPAPLDLARLDSYPTTTLGEMLATAMAEGIISYKQFPRSGG